MSADEIPPFGCSPPSVRHESDCSVDTEPGGGAFSTYLWDNHKPESDLLGERPSDPDPEPNYDDPEQAEITFPDPEQLGLFDEAFGETREKAERVAGKIEDEFPLWRTGGYLEPEHLFADDIKTCYSRGKVKYDADGDRSFEPIASCGNYAKLCPHHARLEAGRRLRRYLAYIVQNFKQKDTEFRFVTFTIPNVEPGKLEEGRDQLWDAWNKFRRRKAIEIDSALFSEETTVNPDDHRWHPHLHGIVEYTSSPDYEVIGEIWRDLIDRDDAPNPEHRAMYGDEENLKDSVSEVIKYISKFETGGESGKEKSGLGIIDWPEGHLKEWKNVYWGKRTLRTYGEWYGIPSLDDPEHLQNDGADDEDAEIIAKVLTGWNSQKAGMEIDLIQVDKSTSLATLSDVLNLSEDVIRKLLETCADPPDRNGWIRLRIAQKQDEIREKCA